VPPLTTKAPVPWMPPANVPPPARVSAVPLRLTVPEPLRLARVRDALLNVTMPLSARAGATVMSPPEATVSAAPLPTEMLALAMEPPEAMVSVPPVMLVSPVKVLTLARVTFPVPESVSPVDPVMPPPLRV
jgi:hypothetical protein